MAKIDQYFLNFTDKLGYIDLKKESSYDLLNKTPLALYTEDLSENVINGEFENKINLDIILDGLIMNLAKNAEKSKGCKSLGFFQIL